MITAVSLMVFVTVSSAFMATGDISALAPALAPSGFAAALDPSAMTVSQLLRYYGQALVPAAVLCALSYALYKLIKYARFKDGFEEEVRRK
jgi:hypothetical protein